MALIEETGRRKELLISSEPWKEKKKRTFHYTGCVLGILTLYWLIVRVLWDPYFMVYWPFQSWLTWELFGPYGIGCMTKKPLTTRKPPPGSLANPTSNRGKCEAFYHLNPHCAKKNTHLLYRGEPEEFWKTPQSQDSQVYQGEPILNIYSLPEELT